MRIPILVVAAIAAFLALSALLGAWYTVDQGERGVILRNGAVIGTAEPGLGWKNPFFDSVVKIPVTQQVVFWTCQGSGDCGPDQRIVMSAYSRDQQPADLRVSVLYHVDATQVADLYAEFGSVEALAERLIARQAPQQVKTVFGQYTAVSVIADRTRFNAQVQDAVMNAIKGPVVIDAVQVENIDFSSAYENSVEQRMMAEVDVARQQQLALKAKVDAEISVTQAKAQADSQLAIAKAKAEAILAEAKAEAEATKLKGAASAEAIEARARALGINPAGITALTTAERWDGSLPATMLPGSAVPFLQVQ